MLLGEVFDFFFVLLNERTNFFFVPLHESDFGRFVLLDESLFTLGRLSGHFGAVFIGKL